MAGNDKDASGDKAPDPVQGGAPPAETPDAIGGILSAFGPDVGPASPPPSVEVPPEDNLPDDVVPIASDSESETDTTDTTDVVPIASDSESGTDATDTTDVVPIAGDSTAPDEPLERDPPGAFHLGHVEKPDDDDPTGGKTFWDRWWKALAFALVVLVGLVLGFTVFGSGSGSTTTTNAAPTTKPVSTTPAAAPLTQSCPSPSVVVFLKIDVAGHEYRRECAGPAQYKSDPTNKYYAYFAWETMVDGRKVQLVVTGGHLTMPVTSKVSPSVAAVSASGTKLADVDLYDNDSGTKNFATSGTVVLNPSGAVKLENVKLKFRGKSVTIDGKLPPN